MDIKFETKLVAERIKKHREKNKLSQLSLAMDAGISQGFLAAIENGSKVPTITTIFKISEALNIKPSALFEDENQESEKIKQEILDKIQKFL
ncbi:MAG: helix-turn-helix transcriptional regulator [Spirochaetales bacterium]|nr:helix-turn-helix transcriptional regulator [Spirochaetales bacterium]